MQQLPLIPQPKAEIQLRPYQSDVINQWQSTLEQHKRTLLVAPTGSGKTLVSTSIIHTAVEDFGWNVLFVVHRDALVGQTYKALKSIGLQCGFIKAGWEEDLESKIQVASVQTMCRRRKWKELDFDLIIYDEAHITSWSTVAFSLDERYPDAFTLGLTATPWRLSKKQGMGDRFDQVINTPLYKHLIKDNFLVPGTYYRLPEADVEGVRTQQGDFAEGELALRCNQDEFVQAIVDEWFRLAKDKITISFAVDVEHAKHIQKAFEDRGVPSELVIGDTPIKQRKRIYEDLATGRTKVLSSVGCLTEGFDCIQIECIILARPTKSKALYFQMVGRGLRISPKTNKKRCLILDQAGNTKRFNKVESLTRRGIKLKEGSDSDGDAPLKECGYRGEDVKGNGGCGNLLYTFQVECPECGYLFLPREAVKHRGQMELLLDNEEQEMFLDLQDQLQEALRTLRPQKQVVDDFEQRYGVEPDPNWFFGALFGEEPNLTQALKLREYCKRTKDFEYLAMQREFGWDWNSRLIRLEAKHVLKKS